MRAREVADDPSGRIEALLRAGLYTEAVKHVGRDRPAGSMSAEREWALSSAEAECHRFRGDFAAALPLARRELQLALTVFGPTSQEVAVARDSLSKIYTGLDRFAEASADANAAMRIMEELKETSGLPYASMLMSMARLSHAQGMYSQQLEWLLRAERVMANFKTHRNYGVVVCNLAVCLELLERPVEARSKYLDALELVAAADGTQHPEYASVLANLACLYAELKAYDGAIPRLEQAVRIYSHMCGPEHQRTISTQTALNECYKGAAKPRPLWGTDTRWRLCGGCDNLIDRQPLVALGTDFLACGGCNNVAYCSQRCVDSDWVVHGDECGNPRPARVRVNVYLPDACAHCYRLLSPTWCPCHEARYCNAECQQLDWPLHKLKCPVQLRKLAALTNGTTNTNT